MSDEPEYVCEILKVLLSNHKHGGSPIPVEVVVIKAAVPSHDLGVAKETAEELRRSSSYPFILNKGDSILIDNGEFSKLVDYLYEECGWTKFKINNSVRHYDVYEHHDFS